jgi:hypothetical protein
VGTKVVVVVVLVVVDVVVVDVVVVVVEVVVGEVTSMGEPIHWTSKPTGVLTRAIDERIDLESERASMPAVPKGFAVCSPSTTAYVV